ncbi:MAG TPA: hypothetical protein VLB12_14065 [Gemmatimonadales bacterium]|nr:hypothetical protein [Gemmatimonadales bacterium]
MGDQPGGNRAIASDGDEIRVVAESRSRYPGPNSDLPGQNLEQQYARDADDEGDAG